MSIHYQGKRFTFRQPDGSPIEVKAFGDQHYAVFETLDGFTVTKDPSTGYYQFANLSTNGLELEPTGARADRFNAASLNLTPHRRIAASSAKAKGLAAFRAMGGQRRCEERRLERLSQITTQWVGRLPRARGPAFAAPTRETVGEYAGLCLLIDFSDCVETISRQQVDDFCNKSGYSDFGNAGSVYDYFLDNSGGKFKYKNQVVPYYRARFPKSYYTDPSLPEGMRARELIREALDHLVAQGFDFSTLTADNQGYVYALNVYYAGAVENNWREGLWPHSWSLATPFSIGDGRVLFDYQFTAMENEPSLGTFCHENGHMVCDYPDLYDYGGESAGVGNFCLMCYSGPDEKNPTQISAYLKYKSGWADSVATIEHGSQISLDSQGNHFAIHRKNSSEYFILEARSRTGRDATLPGSGLAIWHVDELGNNSNEQRTPTLHYELSLEQADGRFDLEARQNPGDASDLYAAPARRQFSDSTVPNSKWWDGSTSNLEIFDVSEPAAVMTFKTRLHGEVETQKLVQTSTPGRSIPDMNVAGIMDTIHFEDDAIITAAKVSLDITHTYRGDLQVTLYSPLGTPVVLHERHTGGSTDDIKHTYDATELPALGALVGQSTAGTWTLHVQDLASADVGVLNEWGLEFEGGGGGEVNLQESPGTTIPDNDPEGITRSLTTNATGTLAAIEVRVNISHTYLRDLLVTLVAPSGAQVILHNRSGGSNDDIDTTYTTATTPDLESLIGQPVAGQWQLKVSDNEGLDVGKLNHWRLTMHTNA